MAPVHGSTITIASPNPNPAFRQPSSGFGYSIGAWNGLLVVGAPGEIVDGLNAAGSVYIFEAKTGSLVRTLVSPNPQQDGSFGVSIAVADGLIVVGQTPSAGSEKPLVGRVYVFNAESGSLVASLVSPNAGTDGTFGDSIGLANGLLVVGAWGENVSEVTGAGRVYIFNERTDSLVQTLTSPNPESYGGFGSAVGVGDGRLAVDALGEEALPAYEGPVYLFSTLTWSLIGTLASPNPENYGYFGSSLSLAGDHLFVGAGDETVDGIARAGRVYVYSANSGSLVNTLVSPEPASEIFGGTVEAAGDQILVGAPWASVGLCSTLIYGTVSCSHAGKIYVFDSHTDSFLGTLVSPIPQLYAQFGTSIVIAHGRIYVGAPGEQGNGVVYIFSDRIRGE
jgi:hypothetical protein